MAKAALPTTTALALVHAPSELRGVPVTRLVAMVSLFNLKITVA